MKITAVLLFSCVLATSRAVAEDWPEFRGPTTQGRVASSKLPLEWSAAHGARWRTELPGQGWSSPIVVDETVFVTAAIPYGEEEPESGFELVALLLDVDSGQLLKQVPLFRQSASTSPKIHSKNSPASPTPVYDGQHVFVHFGHQGTACITTAGDIVWRNDALGYAPVHGNGGSPVVVDELLIFSRDGADIGEITALDKRTGAIAWRKPRDVKVNKQFSFCTPLVLELDSGRQLIFPGSNVVQSVDPATGDELWRVEYDGYSVIPRPIYESGLVFVCTGYDRPKLLAIDPRGSGNVTQTHVKWTADSGISHTPSLVGFDGKIALVSDNGIASCYEATSGKELWRERIGGNFSASPLLAGERLYLLSEQGDCTILDVRAAPRELAKNKLGERCLASLAVVEDDLLLRSADALYRLAGQAE